MARGNRHISHMNDGFETSESASARAARKTRAQRNASEARQSYGELADAAEADRARRLDRAAYPHGRAELPRHAVEGRVPLDPSSPRVRAAQVAQGRQAIYAQQAQDRAAAAQRDQQQEMMRQMQRRAQAMRRDQEIQSIQDNRAGARPEVGNRAAQRTAAQAGAMDQAARRAPSRRPQSDRPAANPLYSQTMPTSASAASGRAAAYGQQTNASAAPAQARVPRAAQAASARAAAQQGPQPRPSQGVGQQHPAAYGQPGFQVPRYAADPRGGNARSGAGNQYGSGIPMESNRSASRNRAGNGYGVGGNGLAADNFGASSYAGDFSNDFGGDFPNGDFSNGFDGGNGNGGFVPDYGGKKKRRVPEWLVIIILFLLLLGGAGAAWAGTGHSIPFLPKHESSQNEDSKEKKDAAVDASDKQAANKDDKKQEADAEPAAEGQVTMTLHGDAETKVMLGEEYLEAGCQAMDATDGDITDSVVAQGEVDTSKEGDYTITYTATNSEGKIATAERTVHVGDFEADQDGVSVLMYHYVYTANDVPDDLNSNYILDTDLAQHLEYLTENDYYFPSFQELRAYIDGTHSLPANSVVLTFDDASYWFLDYGIPVIEKYKVPVTSFVIGDRDGADTKPLDYRSPYVNYQSHSYGLHNAGSSGIGHGGLIYDLSKDEIVEDLTSMDSIVHSREAFAYPFGDVSDDAPDAVEETGILCAFTTEYGQVHAGDDPMLLARMRVQGDSGANGFADLL